MPQPPYAIPGDGGVSPDDVPGMITLKEHEYLDKLRAETAAAGNFVHLIQATHEAEETALLSPLSTLW
jgi:hypothetical protein